MRSRFTLDRVGNIQAFQNPARTSLHPDCAPFKRARTLKAKEPEGYDASDDFKSQRHSAPGPAQAHCVSEARKRLRAAVEIDLRSSSVRKSIVPNSRSQAGGA